MTDDPAIAALIDLHRGLPREGPGDAASTRRALTLCTPLPDRPAILDLGCGSGAPTLELARATAGTITAVDLFPAFLETLRARAEGAGLGHRITTLQADMADPPLADGTFDLIWSEGAIYNIGFDEGLRAWRRLLRPGGCLAVTELSWLTDDPPEDARAWWAEAYPGARDIAGNLAGARAQGFDVIDHFVLPDSAWTEGYYGPLRQRIDRLLAERPDDAALRTAAREGLAEQALYARAEGAYGYVFYVMRRRD